MSDWRVLIVDGDTNAAGLHMRIVAAQPGFSPVAIATSGEEAIAVLERGVPVDLILLEVELAGLDGVTALRKIRRRGGPEVIAITSSGRPQDVLDLIHLGIVDYLVKPVVVERIQESLLRFRDRMRTLSRVGDLEQPQIDLLWANSQRNLLPKGLHGATLDAVRKALREAGGGFSTAEEVARQAEVARVTARRYLEYLVSSRQVEMDTHGEGAGRPRKLYRLAAFAG